MYDKYNFLHGCEVGEKVLFKYLDNKYIIHEENDKYYIYNESVNEYQYFHTPDELIKNGIIENKLLNEVLDNVEIISIEFDTEKEFVMATIMNREIEFDYNGTEYFKSKSDKGYYIYNSSNRDTQYFKTPEDLLKYGRLEGKLLSELWNKINISCIL